MFDKRLANLCDTFEDDDAVVEEPSKWQPLTNVSGQLVERNRDNSTAAFFNNVEIDRLIDNLQHSYQHQLSPFTSSSLSPPVEKNRNGSSSSSAGVGGAGRRHVPNQNQQPTNPVSPNSNKSNNATSRSQNARIWRKEKLLAKVDSLSKDNQHQLSSAPARGLLPDRKSIAKDLRGSDPDLPKEHLDSLYEDLLEAVVAEIQDNQSFLEESCRHLGTSPPEANYLPHPARSTPPGARSTNTAGGGSVANNANTTQSQICFSALANSQRKSSNPKSPKSGGGGGGGNFHLSSPSYINSTRPRREHVLNEHFDDQLLQVSLPDDLDIDNEENTFNQTTYGNIGIHMKAVPRANNMGSSDDPDELKTEDILSHPVVQSLLSEEKVKRWALLKSLYDREATLEKQIESLQTQLRDQTQLANHFKRMQQELITSHCEKENLWEKERQKLVEKLKSGQKKMVFCSKLIFYLLEKDRRDKEEQTNEPVEASNTDAAVDMNKNDVYKYHILNDEDPSIQDGKNSFPFQSNFIFSQKPSIDPKNSFLSANVDGNVDIYPLPTVETNQSELSIMSESEALIKHRTESALKSGGFSCSLTETDSPGFSNHPAQLPSWNTNFVNTELAPLRKMVNNCRANAEKQCRMLRQMFPEASKSSSLQKNASWKKETTKKLAKSFTFPNSNDGGGNSSNESSDDGSDCEQTSHGVVLRSKSFSSSLGLGGNNRGSEREMTSSIDNHHLNFLRPFDGNTTLSMSNSSHMSCSASAISEPPSTTSCQDDLPMPCNDPFDLDLKVKYCSSENIMHAMQTCSLNSPLISPCSSFDEGLASGTSSHTALFGSGIIVSSTTTPNPSNGDSASPVNKTFAQSQPAHTGVKKHSVSNATITDHSTSTRGMRTLSTSSLSKEMARQLSNENAQEVLACNVQNVTASQIGAGNSERRVDSASKWGMSSEQEGSASINANSVDPNESLMIFDSSSDSMNAACSVIKDFDPLDSQTCPFVPQN